MRMSDDSRTPNEIRQHVHSLRDLKRDLKNERVMLVETVRGMRAAATVQKEKSSSRKKHLTAFHENKKIANTAREERDRINKAVPPPVTVLEEWAQKSLTKLQGVDNDLTGMPTLNREIREFSRYFELISSLMVKKIGEESHAKYVKHIKMMKGNLDELEENHPRDELDENGKNNTGSEFKEIRKISNKIDKLDKKLMNLDKEIKSLTKLGKKKESESKVSDALERVRSGSDLVADDIALILEKGGDLGKISEDKTKKKTELKKNHNKPRSRRISVARGGARKTRLRPDR